MEKAILKTLTYADIFDYPLKVIEIQKWLIGRKATLRQVEKALGKLYRVSSIEYKQSLRPGGLKGEYYFLLKKGKLVVKRIRNERQSAEYLRKARMLCQILKVVPGIKLVGISGGLALGNASKKDDIDLFIITAKNRLWISRLLALGILTLIGQRRKVGDKGQKIAGKLCLNILLEEDRLEQASKDIFIAHEVLQMKPLWQRGGIYSKYLEDNAWAFKFLPNWMGSSESVSSIKYHVSREKTNMSNITHDTLYTIHNTFNVFEKLARKFQLRIMKKPKGQERILEGALYFHPEDCRLKVLTKFRRSLSAMLQ
ncbi:MAG: hypothetical protein NUV73_00050 [Candidatus Daviesbacteria bacterium]|nr:hypothetical protein [Candidatus Daviesbacteria bacterium]